MILTPKNCTIFGQGLDHPECVAVGPDGSLYAGGEAGQIYRFDSDGSFHAIGTTGGFVLGIAVDGDGRIVACDCAHSAAIWLDKDGRECQRVSGTADQSIRVPNFAVFDRAGNLFLSDSGDYWNRTGDGSILKIDSSGRARTFHQGPFQFPNGLAIDPAHQWLYAVQSTAPNVVRMPLADPSRTLEEVYALPAGTVPDGIAFTADGQLLIACYKPDCVLIGRPDGSIEPLLEDPTGELLSRPTNVLLVDGKIYVANLGGWHITIVETDLEPAPVYFPTHEQAASGEAQR